MANILLTCLLPLMLTVMGAGVTFMRCNCDHSTTISMHAAKVCCDNAHSHHDGFSRRCMEYRSVGHAFTAEHPHITSVPKILMTGLSITPDQTTAAEAEKSTAARMCTAIRQPPPADVSRDRLCIFII